MDFDRLRREVTDKRGQPRLVTSVFLLVMFATFAYFVSVGVLIPTLPLYVQGPLGGGDVAVGFAIGSFALAAVVTRPLTGRVGDNRGRRVLVVSGGLIVAVTVAAYTLAQTLPLLLALRLLSGFGEAGFYVGAASVINDLAPDDRRAEALSYFSLALFSGLAVGPVVGETVLNHAGYSAVWLVSAAFGLVAGVAGARLPETRPAEAGKQPSSRIVHPAALIPGLVLATSIWGLSGFNTFVPLYALQLQMDGSRLVFVVYSVIVMSIRSFGARLPDAIGHVRSARLALMISGAGLAVMSLWGEVPGLLIGTAIFAVGHAFAFPSLMSIAVRSAPAAERGSVVGTFTAFFDLAFGLGAVSLGAVADVFGYRGSFAVAALVAASGFTLLTMRAGKVGAADGALAQETA